MYNKEQSLEINSLHYSNKKSKKELQNYIMQFVKKKGSDAPGITRDVLASRMEVKKWDSLKKRINGNRTTSRDFLIVLGIQLNLNLKQINKILLLDNDPPIIVEEKIEEKNTQNIKPLNRDGVFDLIIFENDKEPISLKHINDRLLKNNCNLLDFYKESSNTEIIFKILDIKSKTNISYLISNPFNPIEDKYNFDLCSWHTEIVLKHLKSETIFKLKLYNDNRLFAEDSIGIYSDSQIRSDSNFKLLSPYIQQLKVLNNKNKYNNYVFLDDTKNFYQRSFIKFNRNHIKLFTEYFNYEKPYLNEYYFLVFEHGKFKLTISNKSQFLYHYLGSEKYKNELGTFNPIIISEGNNYEELIKNYEKRKNYTSSYELTNSHKKMILKIFKHLNSNISDILIDFENRNKSIRNIDDYFQYRDEWCKPYDYDICQFFNIEHFFEFEKQTVFEEYENYVLKNNSMIYKDLKISITDIRDSFELGFNNIEEIYFVKKKYGNIKKIAENIIDEYIEAKKSI